MSPRRPAKTGGGKGERRDRSKVCSRHGSPEPSRGSDLKAAPLPNKASYRETVYAIVRAIPPGRLMTYGDIGALIPPPQGLDWEAYRRIRARWVGYALAAAPDEVPWQRVVNAHGRISPRPGHGPHLQRILLEAEGVTFQDAQQIELDRHRWEPEAEWLCARGLLYPRSVAKAPPVPREPDGD